MITHHAVDQVYPSNLIVEQVDNWGQYINGFWNSMFGQKNVVVTTRGYNYTVTRATPSCATP